MPDLIKSPVTQFLVAVITAVLLALSNKFGLNHDATTVGSIAGLLATAILALAIHAHADATAGANPPLVVTAPTTTTAAVPPVPLDPFASVPAADLDALKAVLKVLKPDLYAKLFPNG